MQLEQYGYSTYWRELFKKESAQGQNPVRIIAEHKSQYIVASEYGEIPAQMSGRMRRMVDEGQMPSPAVGDFAISFLPSTRDRAALEGILPRRSLFTRLDSFNGGTQALASNIDTALICLSLNHDFNIPRLERYLVLSKQSGAKLAIVLTKADLCDDADIFTEICAAVAGGVPIHALSAVTGQGVEDIRPYFANGETVVALGSSGVGKSTLVNALLGEEIMKTAQIREDDSRGRHTTVHREIIALPSGGLYMDTPGLREIGLYEAGGGMEDVFDEITTLAGGCRFRNCTHSSEPGCAVREALESGTLDAARYSRYLKLQKENAYAENRTEYLRSRTRFFKSLSKRNRK